MERIFRHDETEGSNQLRRRKWALSGSDVWGVLALHPYLLRTRSPENVILSHYTLRDCDRSVYFEILRHVSCAVPFEIRTHRALGALAELRIGARESDRRLHTLNKNLPRTA